jgi:tRNA-2-methylthio-N6-dimethylallyladenosine synthase
MNRPYTIEQYFALVNYARKKIKNVAITTDYIVGFPSETQNDFKQAITNLKKIKFADINVFCYSRRKKTLADRQYKKDLAHEIIAKR